METTYCISFLGYGSNLYLTGLLLHFNKFGGIIILNFTYCELVILCCHFINSNIKSEQGLLYRVIPDQNMTCRA